MFEHRIHAIYFTGIPIYISYVTSWQQHYAYTLSELYIQIQWG